MGLRHGSGETTERLNAALSVSMSSHGTEIKLQYINVSINNPQATVTLTIILFGCLKVNWPKHCREGKTQLSINVNYDVKQLYLSLCA